MNFDDARSFLELLSTQVTEALKDSVRPWAEKQWSKKPWDFVSSIQFLDHAPKAVSHKKPRLSTSPKTALEKRGVEVLLQLASWLNCVADDGYFRIKDRVCPRDLLELGMLVVASHRYGAWEGVTDLVPLDFTAAYLRGVAETCFAEPDEVHISATRLRGMVDGWEELKPDLFKGKGLRPLYKGLLRAAGFGESALEQPDPDDWENFVDQIPAVAGAGSEQMKEYLSETLSLAEQLCELWDQAREEKGLPRVSPPPDLVRRAVLAAHSKSDPLGFARILHIASSPIRRTGRVRWEILPPGWWRQPSYRAQVRQLDAVDRERAGVCWERLDYVDCLGDPTWHQGYLGEQRTYWVAEFVNHVVAECATEGNAIYLVDKRKHDWSSLLALSKRQALAAGAWRIFHDRGDRWKSRLMQVLGVTRLAREPGETDPLPEPKTNKPARAGKVARPPQSPAPKVEKEAKTPSLIPEINAGHSELELSQWMTKSALHISLISRLMRAARAKEPLEGRILKAVAALFETDSPAAAIREAKNFAATFSKATEEEMKSGLGFWY